MSSPQRMRMFGLFCAWTSGAPRTRRVSASTAAPMPGPLSRVDVFMVCSFIVRAGSFGTGDGYRGFHTTKAKMVAAGADLAFAARPHHVTRAILIGAQKGAAAVHALFFARFDRI